MYSLFWIISLTYKLLQLVSTMTAPKTCLWRPLTACILLNPVASFPLLSYLTMNNLWNSSSFRPLCDTFVTCLRGSRAVLIFYPTDWLLLLSLLGRLSFQLLMFRLPRKGIRFICSLSMLTLLVISSNLISLLYMPPYNFTTPKFICSPHTFSLLFRHLWPRFTWHILLKSKRHLKLTVFKTTFTIPLKSSLPVVFSTSVFSNTCTPVLKPKILVILTCSLSHIFHLSRSYLLFL